jgi:hypothetical protein
MDPFQPQSGNAHWVLMEEETRVPARAGALAAADEGVRRCARGGRAPQFLKRNADECR